MNVNEKLRIRLPLKFPYSTKSRLEWLHGHNPKKLPSFEVPESALQELLGMNAPVVGVTVAKMSRTLRITVHPQYLWPKCCGCQRQFFPLHKKQRFCCRNCARRTRYEKLKGLNISA